MGIVQDLDVNISPATNELCDFAGHLTSLRLRLPLFKVRISHRSRLVIVRRK